MEATSAPHPHGLRLPRPRRYLSALSDERLVQHIRRGEPAAFEVLYDRHSAGILGFCRHMLRSDADAEDAVQHTFIAAHADIQRHGERRLHVKAWLYTIARNRCLSILRARREQPSDELGELATDRMAQDVEQRDELRALLADVAKLPEEQREALVLSEVGDLSHAEIAAVLGCEATKVKSLVFQARSALIERRAAREASCEEIREQIATLRGGALRRSHLRHHIESCPGCAAFREDVRRQRAMLALALPVVPTAALRAKVLGAAGLGGSTAAAGAGAGAGAGGLGLAAQGGGLAKLGVAAVLAVGGAGSAAVAHNGGVTLPILGGSSAAQHGGGVANGHAIAHTATAAVTTAAGTATKRAVADAKSKSANSTGSHRSASGTRHGFTPVTGASNGARAREFAAGRGKGKHTGTVSKGQVPAARSHARTDHVKHVAAPPTAHTQPAPKTQTHPVNSPTTTHRQPSKPVKSQPAPTTTSPTSTAGPLLQGDTPTVTAPATVNTQSNNGKSLGAGKGKAAG